MNFFRVVIALALFVTNVNFEEQIIVSKDSIDKTWELSLSSPSPAQASNGNYY